MLFFRKSTVIKYIIYFLLFNFIFILPKNSFSKDCTLNDRFIIENNKQVKDKKFQIIWLLDSFRQASCYDAREIANKNKKERLPKIRELDSLVQGYNIKKPIKRLFKPFFNELDRIEKLNKPNEKPEIYICSSEHDDGLIGIAMKISKIGISGEIKPYKRFDPKKTYMILVKEHKGIKTCN